MIYSFSQILVFMRMLLILFFVGSLSCSRAGDTLSVKTSAQCESCKNRLETRLKKIKGIEAVSLNVENKLLTVVYASSIISKDAIEVKVTEIGYDANDLPAKKGAYKRLPQCCRKDYQGSH